MEAAITSLRSVANTGQQEAEFSGALQGLRRLDASDMDRFLSAVEAGQQNGWGYYFPYLLTGNRRSSSMLVAEDAGSICVFKWKATEAGPRIELALAPTPMNTGVLRRCIERANDFNGDRSARVLRIDAEDVPSVEAAGLRVRPRKEQYVFAPRNYRDLAGKKFYTVRRNVNLVEKLPDYDVQPFFPEHYDACRALLSRWRADHTARHGTQGGVGTSRRALDLAMTLPPNVMRGQVVFVDGTLAAFSLGGTIRSGIACYMERKCDSAIKGLSYFSLRSFLLALEDFEFVNDSSDVGRAGLRQLKNSFRPVRMHTEYRASQRR